MRKKQYELFEAANKRVGQNVRRFLKARGWTIEKLATETDIDKGNLTNALNGKINFTMRMVVRIQEFLKVDLVELFKK
jgi:transcriptional regulator with XRE-family HTH domain